MREILNVLEAVFRGLASLLSGVTALLGFGLDQYQAGLVTGLIMMGLVGFALFRMNIWWAHALAGFRPQRVVQLTARTPFQVLMTSIGSFLKILGLTVIGIALLLGFFGLIGSGDTAFVGASGLLLLILGVIMA